MFLCVALEQLKSLTTFHNIISLGGLQVNAMGCSASNLGLDKGFMLAFDVDVVCLLLLVQCIISLEMSFFLQCFYSRYRQSSLNELMKRTQNVNLNSITLNHDL